MDFFLVKTTTKLTRIECRSDVAHVNEYIILPFHIYVTHGLSSDNRYFI